MKFEYDGKTDDRECVAFIDGCGDLWVSVESERYPDINSVVFFSKTGLANAGTVSIEQGMSQEEVAKKFYPGDKITITF